MNKERSLTPEEARPEFALMHLLVNTGQEYKPEPAWKKAKRSQLAQKAGRRRRSFVGMSHPEKDQRDNEDNAA